jgi:hypothetical protein
MRYWQVRAESQDGAVVTFGLSAQDSDAAEKDALKLVPFDPHWLSVVQLLRSPVEVPDGHAV